MSTECTTEDLAQLDMGLCNATGIKSKSVTAFRPKLKPPNIWGNRHSNQIPWVPIRAILVYPPLTLTSLILSSNEHVSTTALLKWLCRMFPTFPRGGIEWPTWDDSALFSHLGQASWFYYGPTYPPVGETHQGHFRFSLPRHQSAKVKTKTSWYYWPIYTCGEKLWWPFSSHKVKSSRQGQGQQELLQLWTHLFSSWRNPPGPFSLHKSWTQG